MTTSSTQRMQEVITSYSDKVLISDVKKGDVVCIEENSLIPYDICGTVDSIANGEIKLSRVLMGNTRRLSHKSVYISEISKLFLSNQDEAFVWMTQRILF